MVKETKEITVLKKEKYSKGNKTIQVLKVERNNSA